MVYFYCSITYYTVTQIDFIFCVWFIELYSTNLRANSVANSKVSLTLHSCSSCQVTFSVAKTCFVLMAPYDTCELLCLHLTSFAESYTWHSFFQNEKKLNFKIKIKTLGLECFRFLTVHFTCTSV